MNRRLRRTILQTCALAGTLVATPLSAQAPAGPPEPEAAPGSLRVIAYDETPCLPVAGVRVVLAGLDASVVTDSRGVAVFEAVPAGTYELTIVVPGRESRPRRVVIDGGAAVQLAIDVSRSAARSRATARLVPTGG